MSSQRSAVTECAGAPVSLPDPHDIGGIVCDLDGVVYRGPQAVPHAVAALTRVAVPVIYATNNASRTPATVAGHLRDLGLDVTESQVLTSAQAGAAAIATRLPGCRVLAVGGDGVAAALEEAGLEPTRSIGSGVKAVMQGYGPQVCMADLGEAALAIQAGAWWVATNTDLTIPSERGILPGNGTLVAAVAHAVGRGPDRVCGKPEPDLYLVASERLGMVPARILGIGDRLDTDIEGANRAGSPSLLVLTGVNTAADAHAAPPRQRPSAIAADLSALDTLVPTI
ncbi:MAG: HAD-IIA family hydrolase [Actinomycetia bacterium]|nr:HAD-IIA family hydrolase [Actinomycetes bacterium]